MQYRICKQMFLLSLLGLLASPLIVQSATGEATEADGTNTKVRYKQGQDVNFEKLLIQGQLQKPSVTVVTGSVQQGGDGLLRIRKEFMDRISGDYGEESE